MGRAIGDYALISEGDRIMVALSGGKDSYTMLELLLDLKPRSPVHFDLIAVHLDQGHPGYDGAPLRQWLEARGVAHQIVSENTYGIVTQKIPEGNTYCSLCSRLRRGILYQTASALGCHKIALGHHRDDTIETLMLNLLFAGKLSAMPPKLLSDDGQHTVIRPLIYCAEEEIARFAQLMKYPILPCNLCGSQSEAQRKKVKKLLAELESEHSGIKANMLAALQNIRPSQLMDPNVTRQAEAIQSTSKSLPIAE